VNATSASGDAPVHALARDGFVDVVSTLIAFGANTLLENAEGLTAAELAQLELSFDDGARAAGLRACVQLLS
jgi:ankyrin repeat protein